MVQKLSYTANSITLGAGKSKVVLGADSGNLIVKDSDANTSILEPGVGLQGVNAVVTYANPAALPFNPISSAGSLAYTTSTGALYLSNGSGWYKITLVNTAPSISLSSTTASPTATNLTLDFTYTVTEPEGTPTTVSIANSGIATVGNVAVTHTTSNNHVRLVFDGTTKYSGDASVTLSVTDGVNTGTGTITITTAYYAGTNTAETVALLKATGTGNNGAFDDASASNHTVNKNGTVEQLSFSPYRDNGYSMYFDGSGDYLQIANNSDFDLAGEFAYEFWLYRTGSTSGTYQAILGSNGSGSNGLTFYITQSNGALSVFQSSFIISGSAGNISDNKWYHVLLMRDSSNLLQLFIDGNRVSSSTNSTAFTDNTAGGGTRIGYDISANGYFKGYLADIRLIKGSTGGYSSGTSITVPTARLTAVSNTKLLIGGNDFQDASTGNHTITASGNTKMEAFSPYDRQDPYTTATGGGSAYYNNGDSDYLEIPASADHQIYGGNYTVEAWLYPTSFNSQNNVFLSKGTASAREYHFSISASDFQIYWSTDGGSSGSTYFSVSATNNKYEWIHVAITKSGNTVTVYKNGVSIGTGTFNSIHSGNSPTVIGRLWDYTGISHQYRGYISNLRIVKGSVVYSGNFTPPTTPVTAITNTKLLLNFTDSKIYDLSQSVNRLTIEGATSASSTQQHFSENTVYFDGSSDYIDIPNPISGLEDHTHEAWVYPTGGDSTYGGFWSSITTNGATGINVARDLAGGPSNTSSALATFSGGVPANQWSHVVLQRQSGVHALYRNGVLQGTSTQTTNFTSTILRLGSRYNNNTTWSFGGYMHDFRVSKSLSRYPYTASKVTLTQTNSGMIKPDGTTPTATASNTKLLACHHSTKTTEGSATGHNITSAGSTASGTIVPKYGMNSVHFPNGDSDYFQIAASAEHQIYGGDYTVEAWLYPTAFNTNYNYFVTKGGNSTREWGFSISASNIIAYWSTNGSSSGDSTVTKTVTNKLNEWMHVAFAKSGNDITIYKNGSFIGNGTFNSIYSGNGVTTIGRLWQYTGISHQYSGYISNLRIVKGQALYAKNFTPTTEALIS